MVSVIRSEPRALGFGVLHTLASSPGQTFVLALFLPGMKESAGVGDAEIATIYALATLAGAVVLWAIGTWMDRIDIVRLSLMSGGFLALACFLTSQANSAAWLLAGFFGLRLGGQGLLSQIGVTAVARYIRELRGRALSLTSMGHSIGEATLPPLIALSIVTFGWRPTMVMAGAFALLIVIAGVRLVRDMPAFRHCPTSEARHLAAPDMRAGFFRSRYFMMTFPVFISTSFVITAVVFHQALIAHDKGISLQWFAASFSAFALARVASSLLVGPAIDSFGSKWLFAAHLVPLCLGMLLLAVTTSPALVPMFWMAAGVTSGMAGTLQATVLAERVLPSRLGAARSALGAQMILASAAGPAVFGWLLAGGATMFALLCAFAAAMLVASLLAARASAQEAPLTS